MEAGETAKEVRVGGEEKQRLSPGQLTFSAVRNEEETTKDKETEACPVG